MDRTGAAAVALAQMVPAREGAAHVNAVQAKPRMTVSEIDDLQSLYEMMVDSERGRFNHEIPMALLAEVRALWAERAEREARVPVVAMLAQSLADVVDADAEPGGMAAPGRTALAMLVRMASGERITTKTPAELLLALTPCVDRR